MLILLTATPGGGADTGDYTVAPIAVVFNAGETSKDVTVTARDDSVDDDGESVELSFGRLPDGVSEGATARAVVQITDNDGNGIVLTPTSLTVAEGGSSTYTVALDSPPTAGVGVTISGHSGTDLGLNRTSLSFTTSNWNVGQSVTARASQDNDSDNDSATLTHTASGGGYTGVTAALAVTVTDDDAKATGAPVISGSPEVGETLRADTSQIMDADGLSRPGYRYQWVRVASGGVETDIPRATSATYRVVADDVGVALKVKTTFTDDKGNPESAESALTAVVTVAQVVASFGPGPYAALEGGSVRVRVALDKDPHRTVTIPLIAAPRDGADSGDYVAPTEVVFNAGETTKDVTVTAADDDVDDDSESVELVFGRLPVGVSEGATTRAVVQITDNDGRGIDLSSNLAGRLRRRQRDLHGCAGVPADGNCQGGYHGAFGERRQPGFHVAGLRHVRLGHRADHHGERPAGPRREQRFGDVDAHGEGRGLHRRHGGGGGHGDGGRSWRGAGVHLQKQEQNLLYLPGEQHSRVVHLPGHGPGGRDNYLVSVGHGRGGFRHQRKRRSIFCRRSGLRGAGGCQPGQ